MRFLQFFSDFYGHFFLLFQLLCTGIRQMIDCTFLLWFSFFLSTKQKVKMFFFLGILQFTSLTQFVEGNKFSKHYALAHTH